MTEQPPSKESFHNRFVKMWHALIESAAKNTLRYTRASILFVEADKEIDRLNALNLELSRDLARTESARIAILGENAHYKQRVAEFERQVEQLEEDLVTANDPNPLAAEPPQLNVAPIAKCGVKGGKIVWMKMLAPGLPDGAHELFPVPFNPTGEIAPKKEPIHCDHAAASFACPDCGIDFRGPMLRLPTLPPKPAHEREPPHCVSCSCPPYDAESAGVVQATVATPVGFVARRKSDGVVVRDFALPGEQHQLRDGFEWIPVQPTSDRAAHLADASDDEKRHQRDEDRAFDLGVLPTEKPEDEKDKCMSANCTKPPMQGSVLCQEHYDDLPAPMRGETPTAMRLSLWLCQWAIVHRRRSLHAWGANAFGNEPCGIRNEGADS